MGNSRLTGRRLWSAAQTARLALLVRSRLPMGLVARDLGRTRGACYARCREAGIAIPADPRDGRRGSR